MGEKGPGFWDMLFGSSKQKAEEEARRKREVEQQAINARILSGQKVGGDKPSTEQSIEQIRANQEARRRALERAQVQAPDLRARTEPSGVSAGVAPTEKNKAPTRSAAEPVVLVQEQTVSVEEERARKEEEHNRLHRVTRVESPQGLADLIRARGPETEIFQKRMESLKILIPELKRFSERIFGFLDSSTEMKNLRRDYPRYFEQIDKEKENFRRSLNTLDQLVALASGQEPNTPIEELFFSFDLLTFAKPNGYLISDGWLDSQSRINIITVRDILSPIVRAYQLTFEAMPVEIPEFEHRFSSFESEKIRLGELLKVLNNLEVNRQWQADVSANGEFTIREIKKRAPYRHVALYKNDWSAELSSEEDSIIRYKLKDLKEAYQKSFGFSPNLSGKNGTLIRMRQPDFSSMTEYLVVTGLFLDEFN